MPKETTTQFQVNRSLVDRMAGVTQLPTLPVVFSRLQKTLSNPGTSAQDVSKVIEQDQALSSKLLRIVNSAYYGFPGKISSLSRAIVILGFSEVNHLTLSISVMNTFSQNNTSSEFNYEDFWRHAIGVAVCSGQIAKKSGFAVVGSHEEAFVAGLIHDIGIILEDLLFKNDFDLAIKTASKENLYLTVAEKKVLGFSHDECGAFLSESWNLPKKLCSAVGCHHFPSSRKHDSTHFPLISIVHLADIIATVLGLGTNTDPFITQPSKECWAVLGIKMSDIEEIAEESILAYEDMVSCLMSE